MDFVNFYAKLGIIRGCEFAKFFGISQRTIQRWNKNGTKDLRKGAEKSVPRKLTQEESEEIYKVCCSARFKDSNPHEIYHILLDEGVYLASESSFSGFCVKERPLPTEATQRKESQGASPKSG